MAGADDSTFQPGDRVDYFIIVRRLGGGGMGEVYLARDTRLGRKVALKVIRRGDIYSLDALNRFFFEARTTARFNHPHIVQIYSVGEYRDTPYIALEYLKGENLRQRMATGRLSPPEVVRIGLAVAEALAEAHRHHFLHRDLKPENILVPPDGRLRVVDFGLAQLLRPPDAEMLEQDTGEEQLSSNLSEEWFDEEAHGLRGSPPYMAPEQWQQQEPSDRSDVWSLGVILYELLAGQRPYSGRSLLNLAGQVSGPDPVPGLAQRSSHSREIPIELVALVERCLAKSQLERPSAEEVAGALRAMLNRGPALGGEERCPFRGLAPFREQDADNFFGREAEILAFVEQLREQPVMPVVGPSGAGKSSFVHAGVVPRLREQGGWSVLRMRPGSAPFRTLAARILEGEPTAASTTLVSRLDQLDGEEEDLSTRAEQVQREQLAREEELAGKLRKSPSLLAMVLQSAAAQWRTRVALVVDQLEELATQVSDPEERRCFMEALCTAADDPGDPVRVIFTLREDYLSAVTRGGGARAAMGQITVINTPDAKALKTTLIRPLRAIGYRFEDEQMVEEMVASVRREATVLPLLQFAVTELWKARDPEERVLRRAAMDELGGVAGALADHGDRVVGEFSSEELRQAREILLHLVTPQGARRTVPVEAALDGLGEGAEGVLNRLIEARLVTPRKLLGAEGSVIAVELVHESLSRNWSLLRRWLEESGEDLVFLEQITRAAELWQQRGRRDEEIWEGEALDDARHSLRRCKAQVPGLVREYLEAGVRRETGRVRRRRLMVGFVGVALVALSLVFYYQKVEADRQRGAAVAQRQAADMRLKQALQEGALAAVSHGDLLEARAKLRGALQVGDSTLARALYLQLSDEPLRWRRTMGATLYSLAFLHGGASIAAAGQDRAVYLFDVDSGRKKVLRGHRDQVWSVTDVPGGPLLASGSWSGEVLLWDHGLGTAQTLQRRGGPVAALAASPDGTLLAAASYDGTIPLWRLPGGKPLPPLRGHGQHVLALAFSPDGRLLASVGKDQTVRLWHTDDFSPAGVLRGHEGGVYTVAFSRDGSLLASGGADTTVRLWAVAARKQRRVLRGHLGRVNSLVFHPDGKRLISGGTDQQLWVWDLETGRRLAGLAQQKDWLFRLALSHDGKSLATTGFDRRLRYWRLDRLPRWGASNDASDEERGPAGAVYALDFSPDGTLVASAGKDQSVLLWDVSRGRVTTRLSGHTGGVRALDFSPDGTLIASGSSDRTVRVWSVRERRVLRVLRGHNATVQAVRFSPDGSQLATGTQKAMVWRWEAKTGEPLGHRKVHTAGINDLIFSPDGDLIVTSSEDRTVQIWDWRRDRQVKLLTGLSAASYGLGWEPDGGRIIFGVDQSVQRWDPQSGALTTLARENDGRVYFLSVSPRGDGVAAPVSSGVVHLLGGHGRPAQRLYGHRGEANITAFSPRAPLFASGGDDHTVRLWDAQSGRPRWFTAAVQRRPRGLYTHRGWVTYRGEPLARVDRQKSWRRAVERRARRSSLAPGEPLLCLADDKGVVELWRTDTDRRLSRTTLAGTRDLVSGPGGCVVLHEGGATLLPPSGPAVSLAEQASAAAWSDDELLLASGPRVIRFSLRGEARGSIATGAGVTGLGRVGKTLVVGFAEGNLLPFDLQSSKPKPRFHFSHVPASAALWLTGGPRDTVIAGFADGSLGIWTVEDGKRLYQSRLHGAIMSLEFSGDTVYAASELGDHRAVDLEVFQLSRCELLRRIWREVKVEWLRGAPVKRPPSPSHPCNGQGLSGSAHAAARSGSGGASGR